MSRRACYPRPDFRRETWMSLNGAWRFSFGDEEKDRMSQPPTLAQMPLTIEVPYVYQCELSGIGQTESHDVVWYGKTFRLPDCFDERTHLIFGAVDWHCDLFVNGRYAGSHDGGYTPFRTDITPFLRADGEQELILRVEDTLRCDQLRGKQSWEEEPSRCWYTPSTGIWQSVWLERVSDNPIQSIHITPNLPQSEIRCEISLNKPPKKDGQFIIDVQYQGHPVAALTYKTKQMNVDLSVPIQPEDYIDEIHYWTPEHPNLYDVTVSYASDGQTDQVFTYFGFRDVCTRDGKTLLNHRPIYQRLILHQGYYDGGLLTADTDERYRTDLQTIKDMGFNGVRMHQKIEDPLFYYWADKIGLLVWGELPSCYEFSELAMRRSFESMREFIQRDYNHPSIVCWVPLNESWGVRNIEKNAAQQRYAVSLYHFIKAMDSTRWVSTNDGWEQVTTDFCTIHDYSFDGKALSSRWDDLDALLQSAAQDRMIFASGYQYTGQPILLTEFGGVAFKTNQSKKDWGYCAIEKNEASYIRRLTSLFSYIKTNRRIQGYCYTQFTDVMQETNGLLSIRREPKIAIDAIRAILFGTDDSEPLSPVP